MRVFPFVLALSMLACSSPEPEKDPTAPPTAAEVEAARQRDVVNRVEERMRRNDRLDREDLFRQLERLMPAWQADQRYGRDLCAKPVLPERIPAVSCAYINSTRWRWSSTAPRKQAGMSWKKC